MSKVTTSYCLQQEIAGLISENVVENVTTEGYLKI